MSQHGEYSAAALSLSDEGERRQMENSMVLKDERRDQRSAHLVWSPGFVQSLVSSVATLGFAAYVCSTSALIRSFPDSFL